MKARTVLSGGAARYGAEELKHGYQRFLLRALILSSFIHFIFWGTWSVRTGLFDSGGHRPPVARPRIFETDFLQTSILKPLPDFPVVRGGGGRPGAKAETGIPVPVPGFAAENWNNAPEPAAAEGKGGDGVPGGIEGAGEAGWPVEEPPPNFQPIEKEPMVVIRVNPVYPDLARLAGMTGTVTARLWITAGGKVRDVVILKSDSDLFNQAVLDAAKQWVFTPALMNHGPVPVWWSVVFNFTLR
jgi:periplasmic protein TonB